MLYGVRSTYYITYNTTQYCNRQMYGLFPALTREPGVGKSSQLIHLLHFDRAYHKVPRG